MDGAAGLFTVYSEVRVFPKEAQKRKEAKKASIYLVKVHRCRLLFLLHLLFLSRGALPTVMMRD